MLSEIEFAKEFVLKYNKNTTLRETFPSLYQRIFRINFFRYPDSFLKQIHFFYLTINVNFAVDFQVTFTS